MDVTCNRIDLRDAAIAAAAAVNPRSPKPVLQCLKLNASNGQITAEATNLEMTIVATVTQADVRDNGVILLPADRLVSILKELDSDTVTITASDTDATISAGKSQFRIMGDDPADFPATEPTSDASTVTVNSAMLVRTIRRTVYAAAKEAARYALNGALWTISPKTLTIAATDGHRLAVDALELTNGHTATAIVPSKTMQTIAKYAALAEEATICIDDRTLSVTAGGISIRSRLIDGHFPDYKAVIPPSTSIAATVNVEELAAAIRKGAILTSDDSRGVILDFKGDTLTVTGRSPDRGQAEINLAATLSGVESFTIAFNPALLLEALKSLTEESVTLNCIAPYKPCVMREGEHYTHVLMPMEVD